MRPTPTHPHKLGCIAPELGARATIALGTDAWRSDPPLRDHVARCPACRLEQLTFERLDAHAVEASQPLWTQIRAAIRRPRRVDSRQPRPR